MEIDRSNKIPGKHTHQSCNGPSIRHLRLCGRQSTGVSGSKRCSQCSSSRAEQLPKPNASQRLPSIETAINPSNALTVQARVAPLLLGFAAFSALISLALGYYEQSQPEAHAAQLIEIQPGPYSALASAQSSPSVVFVSASDDPNPVTVSMGVTANGATATGKSTIITSAATGLVPI